MATTVHCPTTDTDVDLGRDDVISSHRTREGAVSYLRCTCGGMVLRTPAGLRHVGAASSARVGTAA